MINTDLYKIMLIEMFFNIISPMPFLYKETYQDYYYVDMVHVDAQINTILLIAMIVLRTYHIYRAFLISSYYMSDRAIRM